MSEQLSDRGELGAAQDAQQAAATFVSELLEEAPAAEAAPPPSAPETIGGLLREARLARGLTIVDVTHAIKFGARQIEALERDDFDKLPGNTFVRGLIRSYGKFLRLDEAQLMALLSRQLAPVESEVQVPADTGTTIALSNEKRSVLPWLALAVAIIAGAIALASYFDWPSGDKAKLSQANKLKAPSVRVEQAAVSDQVMPPAGAVPPPDGKQLIFIFDDKAWVEVKDATQKVIFAQNNLPGTRQLVTGKPPFDLVIGNASAVQLQYEDKMIDLNPHTKVDVARLTIE